MDQKVTAAKFEQKRTEGLEDLMFKKGLGYRIGQAIVDWAERLNFKYAVHGNPPVYDNATFPWVAGIEAEWHLIRTELDRVLTRKDELPGFHEIGPALELTVNRAAYEALTDDLKAIIRTAAMASAAETLADFTYSNIRAMQTLIDQGIEIRSFPVAVIKAAAREAEALLKEVSSASPMAGEVYDAFIDYRDKAAAYCRNGELAALKIRELGLAG